MSPRPVVAVACAAPDERAMLQEWLAAAGFAPCAAEVAQELGARVLLVRWPVELDVAAVRLPMVVLFEDGHSLPASFGDGVVEFLSLPDARDVHSLLRWSAELTANLRQLTASGQPVTRLPEPVEVTVREGPAVRPRLIAIGVSTGGPTALRTLFASLAGHDLPPIVVVQHIPGSFIDALGARLTAQTGFAVGSAVDGQWLERGRAVLAPGERHLVVNAVGERLRAQFDDSPPVRGHRPAAEVLFASCQRLGVPGIALVMTGMGRDGAEGMLRLRQQGWVTLGQDEASSAIYGMPRAARELGAVQHELPLHQLGPWLVAYCRRVGVLR